MEPEEYIIDSQKFSGFAKCSFFGAKEYIYLILSYTSKANWHVSVDPDHYDQKCKCYSKDLYTLFPDQIQEAKNTVLARIKNQHTINKLVNINQLKKVESTTLVKRVPINLMKHKDIKIKQIDWRD